MKITKFTIENFKGISNTTIRLQDDVPGSIVTLVGLNESGKTTILEAISNFVTEDKGITGLVGTVSKRSDPKDFIPKDRKAAFTGNVVVKASVEIDDNDIDRLALEILEKQNLVLDKNTISRNFTVERSNKFEDSNYVSSTALWSIKFNLKTPKAKKFKTYNALDDTPVEERVVWQACIEYLKRRMPKIVYFPTFLFDFPDRIYLRGDDAELNAYYKQVIQDVLDSQGEGLDIQKHILDRIDKIRDENPITNGFLTAFFQRDERKQIEAVLQKASHEIGRVIFGSWNQILGHNIANKRVQIDFQLDANKDFSPYLELSILDGQSKFSLSERSLGFRWFFSFLLFTEFRRNRKEASATLFLFDEPAANLHSKAQIKLLESFARIANENTGIIYSTHSHYMINPLWLEKAYIIENKATNYESDVELDAFDIKKTDIKATHYRTFVGKRPSQTTYFQPVLDALEVSFSPLVASSRALIVEGKNDFYPLVYFRSRYPSKKIPKIFPANGADSIAPLISLFRGWGVDFRILLDGDKAGVDAKKRYIRDYFLSDQEIVTLGDISENFIGKSFESIYESDVNDSIKSWLQKGNIDKRDYPIFFMEQLRLNDKKVFEETEKSFECIFKWIEEEFPVD
ncbi:AAA family ATPase [Ochrobactrum sp. BTU1]|uniref:AAA family ATPase n=1 Tax=Ochrobactrum sp. BTU1 TaxID=2840456 RepID=UPI001C056315|nr:AAA family ATPase [Ochrobactrum sp. BTU1]